jgi:hypothetical protein
VRRSARRRIKADATPPNLPTRHDAKPQAGEQRVGLDRRWRATGRRRVRAALAAHVWDQGGAVKRPPRGLFSPLPRVVLAALRWWPLAGGLVGAVLGYGAAAAWGGAAAAPLPAVLLLAGSGASVAVLLVLLLLALPPAALRAAQRWLQERPAARAPISARSRRQESS